MSQSMSTSLLSYYQRLVAFPHRLQQFYKASQHVSTSELLFQVREAKTVTQLTKAVNKVQSRLWNASVAERTISRDPLIDALSTQVLHASLGATRIAAAEWLRLLIQAGTVTNPQDVFVTLVKAGTRSIDTTEIDAEEQRKYLRVIFECFWSFRFPYPAFTLQQFPSNEVFYPLASLLDSSPSDIQALLIAIFSELPSLNDSEIADQLLPIALTWSNHANAEHRCQATSVLARMQSPDAQKALHRLASDIDSLVRNSAKHAASYIRTV